MLSLGACCPQLRRENPCGFLPAPSSGLTSGLLPGCTPKSAARENLPQQAHQLLRSEHLSSEDPTLLPLSFIPCRSLTLLL
jgi:hypothetical protein